MAKKKRVKAAQMSIESAGAKAKADRKEKELKRIKSMEEMREAMKERKELLLEAEAGLPEFSRIFLKYKKAIRESRNPLLIELLKNRETTKLRFLTDIHMMKKKESPILFDEKTMIEFLKTIGNNPRKYLEPENRDKALIETMRRNLKTIFAYEKLSKEAKEELVGQLAGHSKFDEIISDSDTRSFWIKEIIKDLRLKELK